MMMRIFDKISKIFFSFICFIVILGMIFFSVRNYTTPIVSQAVVLPSDVVKVKYYLNGVVSSDNQKLIEVKAARDMDIFDINIYKDQIVKAGVRLFTLDTSKSTSDKREIQEGINDRIYNAELDMNKSIRALEKVANRTITSIDSFNPSEGISIYAPVDGNVKNLSITEGKKLDNEFIANIIDENMLKIAFKMNVNEYPTISVGQKLAVNFVGYEGYYDAEVISINPNSVPHEDNISFVYNGVIHAKNPGLISPGVKVGVSTQKDGQVVSTLTYSGVVESYAEQSTVTMDASILRSMDIYVTNVYVIEGEMVTKGQKIAVIGGEDLENYFNESIKNIKDKRKSINNLRKDIAELYGDTVTFSSESSFEMDSDGICTIPEKIYVEYITDRVSLREGETILRYSVYDDKLLQIKAMLDPDTYTKMPTVVYYGTDYIDMNYKAEIISTKEFLRGYEVSFKYEKPDVENPNPNNTGNTLNLSLNDPVMITFTTSDRYEYVIPKSAIVPVGKMAVNASGYVYIINKEESILGNVNVVSEQLVTIKAVGDDNVSIEFGKNFYSRGRDTVVVNNISSILKDGMRVRLK